MNTLNDFIKKSYPKIDFIPLDFEKKKTNSIAFVISDNKFVIGYISKNGTMCKLIEPLDLSSISRSTFIETLKKLPTAIYFTEKDKQNVIKLLECSDKISTNELKQSVSELENIRSKYNVLIKTNQDTLDTLLLVKKQHSEELEKVVKEYTDKLTKCEATILQKEKEFTLQLEDYKKKMDEYLKSNIGNTDDLKNTIRNLYSENSLLQQSLKNLKTQVESDKSKEIIEKLQKELENIKKEYSNSSLKSKLQDTFYKQCSDKLVTEKQQIIQGIKNYTLNWLNWTSKNCTSNKVYVEEKVQLLKELTNVKEAFKVLSEKCKEDKDTVKNLKDIKNEIAESFKQQLNQLNEQNKLLKKQLEEKNKAIKDLQTQLDNIGKNLEPSKSFEVDYKNCKDIFEKFVLVNNTFARKLDILLSIKNIIDKKAGVYGLLDTRLQVSLKKRFETVYSEINSIIETMNLQKYTNSPYIHLFKNNNTLKDIPPEFCNEISNVSKYWNDNINAFQEKDLALSSLYEDLSGAVRVYVKVKPLEKEGTVTVNSTNNSITIDCLSVPGVNRRDTYTDFYEVFDEKLSNKQAYSGTVNVTNDLTIGNNFSQKSIHNAFRQVTQGYSVVLSGYGLSGSGKTYTLLGANGTPGMLHYILANFPNVKQIKLKYMFEQYINAFVPTLNILRGSIINLVGKFPDLKSPYTKDERIEFKEYLSESINLSNITPDVIAKLVNLIDAYRKSKSRIKKTPNNPESSRSHLFMVFEIEFNNGIKGYTTILDCAGRESPIDLFKMYIDTSKKVSLVTLLGPSGGPKEVEKYLKDKYIGQSKQIYEILNESFYVNETTNHLIYFFNKKNFKYTTINKNTINDYSISKYFVNPETEENKLSDTNFCLTVNILNFLDSLGTVMTQDDFKPTKFITITCVRKDKEYCDQIFSTLDFASSIKST